ncbi:hypothetical protein SNE40_021747 [Patella caerulea]|uniref:Uncharacterized protein n=1 Tax=Patella caerulea TaxID=87958 RepID=A0AAN8IY73_PATCE
MASSGIGRGISKSEYFSKSGKTYKVDIAEVKPSDLPINKSEVHVKVHIPNLPKLCSDSGMVFVEKDDCFVYTPYDMTCKADQITYTFIHREGQTIETVAQDQFIVKCGANNICIQSIPFVLPTHFEQEGPIVSIEVRGMLYLHSAVMVNYNNSEFVTLLHISTENPRNCKVVFSDGTKDDCLWIESSCNDVSCSHFGTSLRYISEQIEQQLKMSLHLWNTPRINEGLEDYLAVKENREMLKSLHVASNEYASSLDKVIDNRKVVVTTLRTEGNSLQKLSKATGVGKIASGLAVTAGIFAAPFTMGASLGVSAVGALGMGGASAIQRYAEKGKTKEMDELFKKDRTYQSSLAQWERKFCRNLDEITKTSLREMICTIISCTEELENVIEEANKRARDLLRDNDNDYETFILFMRALMPKDFEEFKHSLKGLTESQVAKNFFELAETVEKSLRKAGILLIDLYQVTKKFKEIIQTILGN